MTGKPPQFVLLFHNHPEPHYDLMLEEENHLQTWRLSKNLNANLFIAERIQDHRMDYLDYEGPISGDRGSVKRIDRGTYKISAWTEEFILLELDGQSFKGDLNLDRLGPDTWGGTFIPLEQTPG